MHVGHTQLIKSTVCWESFELIKWPDSLNLVNNNNDEKYMAARFLQGNTKHNMFREYIAAIDVMLEYLSHYQFVFHAYPLFINDELVQVIF